MNTPEPAREVRAKTISAARNAARRATIDLALQDGARVIRRPAFRGAQNVIRDVEPIAGMRAAREIELGARYHTRTYIRDAREAGRTWHEIGRALGLVPGGEADQAGQTIAEAAYTYGAGHPDSETAWRYGRSFPWRCGSCEGLISDRGPFDGPADAEPGHGGECARLAATLGAWDAEWEVGD